MPRNIRPARLTIEELRALWLNHNDDAVRGVIEEIVVRRLEARRIEGKVRLVEELCEIVRAAWTEEVGNKLIAIEQLRGEIRDLRRLGGELPGETTRTGERPRYNTRYYGGIAK